MDYPFICTCDHFVVGYTNGIPRFSCWLSTFRIIEVGTDHEQNSKSHGSHAMCDFNTVTRKLIDQSQLRKFKEWTTNLKSTWYYGHCQNICF